MLIFSGLKNVRLRLILIAFLFLLKNNYSQKVICGPMLGPCTDSSMSVWYMTKNEKESSSFTLKSYNKYTIISDTNMDLFRGKYNAYQVFFKEKNLEKIDFSLSSKKLNKQYSFNNSNNNSSFVFGSCAYISSGITRVYRFWRMNKIYKTLAGEDADKMFWIGDNLYLMPKYDTKDLKSVYNRYISIRKTKKLNSFLSSGIKHYATWDDHDYGPNNCDGNFKNGKLTKTAFLNFWINENIPKDSGIYNVVHHPNIDFFLLDTKTFYNVGEGSFLGKTQLSWLKSELLNSKATFKVLVFSNQVVNPLTNHETINKVKYRHEKEELFNYIHQQNINGVLIFSGDRHFAEIQKEKQEHFHYPMFDVTSSPLSSPRHHVFFIKEKENHLTRVDGSLFLNKNYVKGSVVLKDGVKHLNLIYKNKWGKPVYDFTLSEKDLGY